MVLKTSGFRLENEATLELYECVEVTFPVGMMG